MMQDRLPNGASVNRVFSDYKNSELLGLFQYETDAVQFAKAKVFEDQERKWYGSIYVVTSTYNGRVKVFPVAKPEEAAAA